MKKLLTLLLTGFALNVSAQKIKLNWSEESKEPMLVLQLLHTDDGHILKLAMNMNMFGGNVTPTLFRYDESLNLVDQKSITASEKNIDYAGSLRTTGGYFMMLNQYDKSDKSTSYYAQRIDTKTLQVSGDPVRVGAFEAISRSRQSNVRYERSRDSSKVLLFGTAPNSARKSKDNERYYMGVFDENMKKTWEANVELPYQDKYIDIYDYLVTNDGDVCVIIKHYDQEVKRESVREEGAKVPSYKVKLLVYKKGSDKPHEYVLATENKYVASVELTSDDQGKLSMLGLYKTKQDGFINGYFLLSVDMNSDKIDMAQMNPFPPSLVNQVHNDGQGGNREKDPGLSIAFHLASVQQRSNHSLDYILEYDQETHITYTHANGMTTTVDKYKCGDIIDMNVATDGTVKYARIAKEQSDKIGTYTGFLAMPYGEKLLIFYNDDPKNLEREADKSPKSINGYSGTSLILATVSETGAVHRRELFDHDNTKLTTCVKDCVMAGPNRLVMYAMRPARIMTYPRDMIGTLTIE